MHLMIRFTVIVFSFLLTPSYAATSSGAITIDGESRDIQNKEIPGDQGEIPDESLKPDPDVVFCPADAKQCPDGSYVGRVPPDCQFEPCR